MSDGAPPGSGQDRLSELRASAKGWHGVQMAVLGFIGLCGELQVVSVSDPVTASLQAVSSLCPVGSC